jgi:hypothetical protein
VHKLQKTEPLNEHYLLLVNLVVASHPVVLNDLVLPVINPLTAEQQLQIGVQQPLWALVVPVCALLVELGLVMLGKLQLKVQTSLVEH